MALIKLERIVQGIACNGAEELDHLALMALASYHKGKNTPYIYGVYRRSNHVMIESERGLETITLEGSSMVENEVPPLIESTQPRDKPFDNESRLMQVFIELNGYTDLHYDERWGFVGLLRFIFTYGVCYGLHYVGYKGRYCFNSKQNASLFLNEWNGVDIPIVGEDGCTAIK